MKILTEGKIPEPPTPEWVGRQIDCPNCRTRFELEAGDKVQTWADRSMQGDRGVEVNCPFCQKALLYSLKTNETVLLLRHPVIHAASFWDAIEKDAPAIRPFYPPSPAFDHFPQPSTPYLDSTARPMCCTQL